MKLNFFSATASALLVVLISQSAYASEKLSAQDYAYNATCLNHLRSHIKRELQASVTYLAMGAWANHYSVQRPGLADFFFDSASEEREHGLKLLGYLRMRGHNELDILPSSLEPLNGKYEWENSLSALRQALKMEKDVTDSIKKIIDYCADAEDHQLADYLTGDFMEEQLKGQRNIAGLANTLQGVLRKQPRLGDWIFDNNLSKSKAV
ncbi:ferritin heavy chain-like [Daphnia carinata]|uniref:ferritin heavy chain-like n=1 Tax=Daphnia carinata TaxID=120202 RepID=UPI00258040D1|nr:ferritin heavy chain-like [Daphnia carinata]